MVFMKKNKKKTKQQNIIKYNLKQYHNWPVQNKNNYKDNNNQL